MNDIVIPTAYCSFNDDYINDESFSQLCQHQVFDFSFSENSIFSNKFESVLSWVVYIIKEYIQVSGDDLFVVCNSELQFSEHISRLELLDAFVSAGQRGGHLLLGGLETARDLYRISDNLIWTDIFCHCPFMVIYKSAYEPILEAYNSMRNTDHTLELFLSLNLDYKFFSYPFFVKLAHISELGIENKHGMILAMHIIMKELKIR